MSVADYALPIVITKRSYFGKRQITCQDQLYKGRRIIIHGPGDRQLKAIICDRPFRQTNQPGVPGLLIVEFECAGEDGTITDSIALEEYSVVRYEDHSWNLHNWLERV